jgi:hypothetical protein
MERAMNAHVSYIGLLKAQQKPIAKIGKVLSEPLTVEDMRRRTLAARKALGLSSEPGKVAVSFLPGREAKAVAEAVLEAPEATQQPVVIVVRQEQLDEADDKVPLFPQTAWKTIIREVAAKHGVEIREMLSQRRGRPVVAARHEAVYRMRYETTMSLPQIGRRMGGRDHSTVLHGIRSHECRLLGMQYRPNEYGKTQAVYQQVIGQ